MKRRWAPAVDRRLGAAAIALLLSGCGADSFWASGDPTPPPDTRDGFGGNADRVGTIWDMFGGGGTMAGVTFGDGGEVDPLAGAVNRHLWQASLDTLSFMPIASTDPFTGVIATDWAAPPQAPGERFKVTAYVTDTALRADALRVAVFKESLDDSGAWRPAMAAPETARQIEDAILVRARQLRLAEEETG
jgi:hypothetical protein